MKVDKAKKGHKCGVFTCHSCCQEVKKDGTKDSHQYNCYMQPLRPDPEKEERSAPTSFIFLDFEAHQSEQLGMDKNGKPINRHKVNYAVAHKVCDECKDDEGIWDGDGEKQCRNCLVSRLQFYSIEETCRWLFSGANKGATVFAHNAGGYDWQFVLRYMTFQHQYF